MSEDKRAQAVALRREGMYYYVIAQKLGVGRTTVWRWTNPDAARERELRRNEYKREWERVNRKDTCPSCGDLKDRRAEFCRGCSAFGGRRWRR